MKSKILLKALVAIAVGISMASCGGGGSGSSNSGNANNPPPGSNQPGPGNPGPNPGKNYTTALTISDIGVVPQIAHTGTQPVSLYVYNHGDKPISNVTYKVLYVSSNALVNISPSVATNCNTINVDSSCALGLEAGIGDGTGKGSAIIEASYTSGNSVVKFDQLVNFQEAQYTPDDMIFASDFKLNSYGNPKSHGVSYLHAAELISREYAFKKFNLDNQNLKITAGDLSGSTISSSFVHAVAINSPTSKQSLSSKLAVTASTNGSTVNVVNNIDVAGSDLGAILNLGFAPAIDTGIKNTTALTGSLPVINNGSKQATITKIAYPAGVKEAAGSNKCTEGMKLDIANSCILYFNVENDTGSGAINLTYSGGSSNSSSQAVNWYNSTKTPAINAAATPSNISLKMSDQTPKSVILNVSNVGGFSVKLGNLGIKNAGAAKVEADLTNSTCKSNTELVESGTCYYMVKVTPISPEDNKSVTFSVNGTYTNQGGVQNLPYSVSTNLTYSVVEDRRAILSLSNPEQMIVTGNGVDSVKSELIVTNNGQFDATTLDFTFEEYRSHKFITIDQNATTCVGSLAANKSCKIAFVLQAPQTRDRIDNGGLFKVIYSGNNTPTTPLEREVSYIVLPMNVNVSLVMDNMPELGDKVPEGKGEKLIPYRYYGNDASQKFVRFTYRNAGNVALTIENITSQALDARAWKSSASSTCESGAVVQAGASCSLIYQNVIAETQAASQWLSADGIQTVNIPTPKFDVKTPFGDRLPLHPEMPRAMDKDTLYINTTYTVIQPSARVYRSVHGQLLVGIKATRKNSNLSDQTNFKYSFQNKFPIVQIRIIGECNNQNGSGEVGKYSRGLCDSKKLETQGEASYYSGTYYSSTKDGTELKFDMDMPSDGTYIALSPLVIKTPDLKPSVYATDAFIGFSTAQKVIRCPIGPSVTSARILADKCHDIYNTPGKEIFSLRLLQSDPTKPNAEKLLIGGDDGIAVYDAATNTPKRLSADWKLNFISGAKDVGGNRYEFFGAIDQGNTYLKYVYDAANNALLSEAQQFYQLGGIAAHGMSYIDRSIKSNAGWPLTIIAHEDSLFRNAYNCFENARDRSCSNMIPYVQIWHKPYRMHQEQPDKDSVWTYTTDWNWGRLDLFKGTLNDQFNGHKPSASVFYGNETGVSDVKPDGVSRGIYVTAVKHSEWAVCHYTKELGRNYCLSAAELKNNSPTSIEILTKLGYH
jgi:hypothetical protein